MIAWVTQELAWLHSTRPVAQCFKTHMDKTANKWRLWTNTEGFALSKIWNSLPQPPLLQLSSEESNIKKYRRAWKESSFQKATELDSKEKPKDRYNTTSSDRDVHTTPLGHDIFFPHLFGCSRIKDSLNIIALRTNPALQVFQLVRAPYNRDLKYLTYHKCKCFHSIWQNSLKIQYILKMGEKSS